MEFIPTITDDALLSVPGVVLCYVVFYMVALIEL